MLFIYNELLIYNELWICVYTHRYISMYLSAIYIIFNFNNSSLIWRNDTNKISNLIIISLMNKTNLFFGRAYNYWVTVIKTSSFGDIILGSNLYYATRFVALDKSKYNKAIITLIKWEKNSPYSVPCRQLRAQWLLIIS